MSIFSNLAEAVKNAAVVTRYNHHITIAATDLDKNDYATAMQYEANVKRVLDILNRSKTGHAVIRQMDIGRKNLVIMPYNAADKKNDEFNAYAQATDFQHATPKDEFEHSGKDGSLIRDAKGRGVVGLGGGSDSVIHYSSSTWFSYIHSHKGHTSGATPDEILLHEMVHALRQMIGKANSNKLGHLFDTEEEFFAVVVADIYASELGRTADIRSDHHGFDSIADTQDTSAEFLPKVDQTDYKYRLIEKFVKQEPHLCTELAKVSADFNPIRRYFDLTTGKAHAAITRLPATHRVTSSRSKLHRHDLRHGMPVRRRHPHHAH